jgi:hypothetical protein
MRSLKRLEKLEIDFDKLVTIREGGGVDVHHIEKGLNSGLLIQSF